MGEIITVYRRRYSCLVAGDGGQVVLMGELYAPELPLTDRKTGHYMSSRSAHGLNR